jgi:hypothetical protein
VRDHDDILRPEVKKHLQLFTGYRKQLGAEGMKELLTKGKHGPYKLKVLTNRKDRYQMMQMLDLVA